MSTVTESRFCIINWINDTLLLPLTKIEQLGSGSVYCQLLDAAYPERVPLHKVKWDAKLQIDFLHNFKILVTSFQFLGIEKYIDIQRLAKAKYQDNLEFIQWLKAHLQTKIDYASYEPLKRRNYAKLYLGFANKTKFNVTLNSNKQNLDNSFMKSSIKSNTTMKSSTLSTNRSSASIMTMSAMATKLKTVAQKPSKQQKGEALKGGQRRKNVGPISFISLNPKGLNKNQSCVSMLKNNAVKNVEIIQSQSEDQFF